MKQIMVIVSVISLVIFNTVGIVIGVIMGTILSVVKPFWSKKTEEVSTKDII